MILIKKIAFSIYPNPVSNQTNLNVYSDKDENISLQVVDIVGRVYENQKQAITQGSNNINLDVSKLPSGVYFISINNEVQKFIKN